MASAFVLFGEISSDSQKTEHNCLTRYGQIPPKIRLGTQKAMHLILLIQTLPHEHHETGSPLSNARHTRYQIEKGTTKAKIPTMPKSRVNPIKASIGLFPTNLKKEKRK